ncbi:MAG: hypothetical protein AB4426_17865 [Xenococcaceae cyanobacterium]
MEQIANLRKILNLLGLDEQQHQLCDRYGCNTLGLKIVATSIQELFDGEIGELTG